MIKPLDLDVGHLREKFIGWNLPASMFGGIERYLYHGIPPGHFLAAVLQNDLSEAVSRADAVNGALLCEYVKFLYNDVPANAWGSKDEYAAWIDRGGLNGEA